MFPTTCSNVYDVVVEENVKRNVRHLGGNDEMTKSWNSETFEGVEASCMISGKGPTKGNAVSNFQ